LVFFCDLSGKIQKNELFLIFKFCELITEPMNILMVNWTWYPSGGDWTYVDTINRLYEANGHTIIPFSMKDERNEPTVYSKYFVDKIDYKELNKDKSLLNSLKVISKSLYSLEAKRNLKQLLSENKVDIAQLNNINNYLTPSIISVLKEHNIPIVWRILDYKLICPNTTFVSGTDVCEECKVHKYYKCVAKKCKKNSHRASLIAALENYIYTASGYYNKVDMFSFQSNFTKNKFIEYGFDSGKTVIIGNPINYSTPTPIKPDDKFILFFGRLEKLKGIYTLLSAMQEIPEIKLKIIGAGQEDNQCLSFINEHNLTNVEFLGSRWGAELEKVLRQALFVVVPSEWYEPSPYAILQTLSFGKPVIGSRMGGIADLIKDGYNGFLVAPKDPVELANKIRLLWNDENKIDEFGINALKTVAENHSQENYYSKSMDVFEALLRNKKR
jgi:glycosyltransferase involved in cell wall biosynthesis